MSRIRSPCSARSFCIDPRRQVPQGHDVSILSFGHTVCVITFLASHTFYLSLSQCLFSFMSPSIRDFLRFMMRSDMKWRAASSSSRPSFPPASPAHNPSSNSSNLFGQQHPSRTFSRTITHSPHLNSSSSVPSLLLLHSHSDTRACRSKPDLTLEELSGNAFFAGVALKDETSSVKFEPDCKKYNTLCMFVFVPLV